MLFARLLSHTRATRKGLLKRAVLIASQKRTRVANIFQGKNIYTHSVHHTLLPSVPLTHSLTISQCSWKKREEADYKLSVNAVSFFLIVDDYA